MSENNNILIVKTDLKEVAGIERFLFRIFEKFNLPQNSFNKVLLCINEAVTNAMQHGNCFDSNKDVKIEISCSQNLLDISISDEGKGFNFCRIENPTHKNYIKREGGRGIFIIKSLASNVNFSEGGSCINFIFKF